MSEMVKSIKVDRVLNIIIISDLSQMIIIQSIVIESNCSLLILQVRTSAKFAKRYVQHRPAMGGCSYPIPFHYSSL